MGTCGVAGGEHISHNALSTNHTSTSQLKLWCSTLLQPQSWPDGYDRGVGTKAHEQIVAQRDTFDRLADQRTVAVRVCNPVAAETLLRFSVLVQHTQSQAEPGSHTELLGRDYSSEEVRGGEAGEPD